MREEELDKVDEGNNKEEEKVEMHSDVKTVTLADEVNSLKKSMTTLAHQMNMIMGALRVPPCQCQTCADCIRQQHFRQLPHPIFRPHMAPPQLLVPPNHGDPSVLLHHPHQPPHPTLPVLPPSSLAKPDANQPERTPSENGSTSTEGEIAKEATMTPQVKTESAELTTANQLLHTLFPGVLQSAVLQPISNVASNGSTPNPFAGIGDLRTPVLPPQNHGGRKSKYCTPEEKRKVAEYASIHGAANAARKFNIPPSVAAYYQRKLARLKHNDMQAAAVASMVLPGMATIPLMGDHSGEETSANEAENPTNGTETTPILDSIKVEHTPTTPTTPTFLRGRGRGRPKLIGDELDAELVEYMVKVKQANPGGHLSASNALEIARDYILKKAPGLLEEHGGNIKLKLTWAMKLVSRIAERQKEMELGLPAGTLSNMGRAGLQQLANVSGNDFMAGMAQNMAWLQQIQQMGEGGEGGDDEPLNIPEITNVKELKLENWNLLPGNDNEDEEMEKDEEGATTPDEMSENNEKSHLEAAISNTIGQQPLGFANAAF